MTERGITEEERALVERAIARDEEAFAALYETHVSRIYRQLLGIVGQEAEDLTAETFLRAWKAIDSYQMRGVPFISWLRRIAHNQAMSYFRSHKETNPLPEALADGSSARDPELRAERRVALANVKEAISHLCEEQRRVLSLRLLKDEDYETVAAQMGRSVPAVRVIKHRGLRKIRDLIGEAA